MMQLTLTLKMTTAQVVETSVTINNNSPIQDYVHPDDHAQPTYEMTHGLKHFIILKMIIIIIIIIYYYYYYYYYYYCSVNDGDDDD